MICDNLRRIVGDAYELEDYIIDRLEFSYKKLISKKGNAKYIPINNDDELLDDNHFKLSEISLKVHNQEHDTVEKDCSCDSEYMLSAMNRVGEASKFSLGSHIRTSLSIHRWSRRSWNKRSNHLI